MQQSKSMQAVAGDFLTIDTLMCAAAEQFADRDAYVEDGNRLSFAEWLHRSDAVAIELRARGVGRGDVVALMLPSSIDYAVCYAAAMKLGAVTTGLNTRLGRREVESIFSQCSPALVIRDEAAGLAQIPAGVAILTRDELPAIYEHSVEDPPREVCEESDPVTIMWTSGTTGQPKGVFLDHRNMQAIAAAAGPISVPGDRKLMSTPFVHAGYMAKLWDQIATASTVVMSPAKWDAEAMLRQIVEERISVIGAVPAQWEKLVLLPELATADLSSVRVGTVATAPARPELVEAVKSAIGCPLIVRYAMTESPSICGTDPDDSPEVQFRTVGKPQYGMEISVAAEPGEVGVVRIRGGCVMRGYWNAPDLTAQAFDEDGWLVSGDLGYVREDGNLVIAGRATDMYIRGGYNIYPAEVEAVLALHPGVARVSVVGTPAPVIGEIGVAFVIPNDPAQPPGLDELRELVRKELADYKAPDWIEVVSELPVNAMHKVNKRTLRELAASLDIKR